MEPRCEVGHAEDWQPLLRAAEPRMLTLGKLFPKMKDDLQGRAGFPSTPRGLTLRVDSLRHRDAEILRRHKHLARCLFLRASRKT